MVRVFATHDELLPVRDVPGMPIQYVYLCDYEEALSNVKKEIIKLDSRNAVLERVIARQDAMLVAKDKYEVG